MVRNERNLCDQSVRSTREKYRMPFSYVCYYRYVIRYVTLTVPHLDS